MVNKESIKVGASPAGKDSRLSRMLKYRGMRLRTWRTLSGHTQEEVASILRVHVNTVYNWEKGAVIPRWAIDKLIEMGWPRDDTLVS